MYIRGEAVDVSNWIVIFREPICRWHWCSMIASCRNSYGFYFCKYRLEECPAGEIRGAIDVVCELDISRAPDHVRLMTCKYFLPLNNMTWEYPQVYYPRVPLPIECIPCEYTTQDAALPPFISLRLWTRAFTPEAELYITGWIKCSNSCLN